MGTNLTKNAFLLRYTELKNICIILNYILILHKHKRNANDFVFQTSLEKDNLTHELCTCISQE